VGEIVARHEVLHTTFYTAGGQPVQAVGQLAAGVQLTVTDLCGSMRPRVRLRRRA
jgi:hypothetical protein